MTAKKKTAKSPKGSKPAAKKSRIPVAKEHKKQTGKKYIPVMQRSVKASEFSSTISKHAAHNPNASSVRGKENAQLRNAFASDKKVKSSVIALDITSKPFASLISSKLDYGKKSNYDRLLASIVSLLIKKGCNKAATYSFAYKHRDTKQSDSVIALARRVRTAMKALYLNDEPCAQIEFHRITGKTSAKKLSALRFYS